jgi:hypothetical protein
LKERWIAALHDPLYIIGMVFWTIALICLIWR